MTHIAFYFRNKFAIVSLLFIIITINTQVSKANNLANMTEWWINTIFLLLFIAIMVFTFQKQVSIRYKILVIPVSWLVHGLLTIPAAMVLGILKYNPNHIRTAGEHRAVFILASIPIVIYFITKSNFLKE